MKLTIVLFCTFFAVLDAGFVLECDDVGRRDSRVWECSRGLATGPVIREIQHSNYTVDTYADGTRLAVHKLDEPVEYYKAEYCRYFTEMVACGRSVSTACADHVANVMFESSVLQGSDGRRLTVDDCKNRRW